MQEVDPNDELIALAASCQFDPHQWSQVAWDWGHGSLDTYTGPREWQEQINQIVRDHLSDPQKRFEPLRIAVASGHGIGKSAEMGMLSSWAMSTWDDARILCTANTDTQLRTKTVPEVGKWFKHSITAHWFDTQATSIKAKDPLHDDSWRMDCIPWSEHNTEAFAGLHNKGKIILILFDEASKISDKIWEVVEGAMSDEDTVIIWVAFGNPTRNTGRFRECFRRYKHRWHTMQIDSRTVEGTNKKLLAQWAEDYGEDSDFYKIRVRGMFPSMSAAQFYSEKDIDAAFGRHLRKEQYEFAPVIIGVDPAWQGDDELVIVKRQGLYSEVLATMAKNDDDVAVANMVARFEDEYQADAVFVDLGYGTGIVSVGRNMNRDWVLVPFGGESADEGCLNKRAEMLNEAKKWLKEGGAIPEDNVLRDEMQSIETVPRVDGKLQFESKKSMKQRGLTSPNRLDALGLTFAFPVYKATKAHNSNSDPYDPYKEI